jgi:outer membrane immunogenic protein
MSKLHSGFIRGFVVAGAVSFAALCANAADMYRAPEGVSMKDAPVYEPVWTGFYAGVNGGYGWSANDSKLQAYHCDNPCPQTVHDGSGSTTFKTDGGFGGGQIGYNWQPLTSGGYKDGPTLSHIVLGIEADIQGAAIDGNGVLNISGPATATGKNDLDWFGTVRGRLGYAMDGTLLYFTGGFAFGGVKDTLTLTSPGGAPITASTATKDSIDTGYVLGGGIEHFFSRRWSGKIEYQYIDLGDDKLFTSTTHAAATFDAEHTYNTVRLGLNYHFDRGYEPLK